MQPPKPPTITSFHSTHPLSLNSISQLSASSPDPHRRDLEPLIPGPIPNIVTTSGSKIHHPESPTSPLSMGSQVWEPHHPAPHPTPTSGAQALQEAAEAIQPAPAKDTKRAKGLDHQPGTLDKKHRVFRDIVDYYQSSTSSSTPRKRLNPDPLRKRRVQKGRAGREVNKSPANLGEGRSNYEDRGGGAKGLINLGSWQAEKNSLGVGGGIFEGEIVVNEEELEGG
jgi:hypothetical protein